MDACQLVLEVDFDASFEDGMEQCLSHSVSGKSETRISISFNASVKVAADLREVAR